MKVIKIIGWVLVVAVCLWMLLSFVDIVADNKSENPQHSDLNFFVLISKDEEPKEEIRVIGAKVLEINEEENTIALIDYYDEVWVAEVQDTAEFELGELVQVVFTDNATEDLYDDEIIDIKQ